MVFENKGGYEFVRKKDIVTSYDINYWGDKKALQWAKAAAAQTKRTVVLRQKKNYYEVIQ